MKEAFVYGPFAVCAATFFVFVLRCRFKIRAQAVWMMALLLCFSKFFCFRALGGDALVPWLPEKVIWIWNALYSGAMILFALALVAFPFRFRRKGLVLPVLAWSLAVWGVWNGIRPPAVKEVTLVYDALPAALDGYRIAHLSDLHVSSAARRWRTEATVARVNAAKADLICLTGDLMDGEPARCRRFIEPLRRLTATDGVYASTGNHEFYYYAEDWIALYERWGIRFLRNACAFPRPELALAGVEDAARDRQSPRWKMMPNAAAAFAAATNGAFRVLMEHRPENARRNAAEQRVALQLSGHTHGGIMPGLSWIVARCNKGFVRGVYELSPGQRLAVSPGSGQWAGFPVRFFNPAEITVFTLKKGCSPAR
jgi:predicted MPP superfamily phosphohydrolase